MICASWSMLYCLSMYQLLMITFPIAMCTLRLLRGFTQPMRIGDASDLVFLLVSSNQRKSSPLGCPRPRFSQDIRSLPAASAKVAEYSHDISENWGAYSSKATLSTAGV